jgi:hypothetical protein
MTHVVTVKHKKGSLSYNELYGAPGQRNPSTVQWDHPQMGLSLARDVSCYGNINNFGDDGNAAGTSSWQDKGVYNPVALRAGFTNSLSLRFDDRGERR